MSNKFLLGRKVALLWRVSGGKFRLNALLEGVGDGKVPSLRCFRAI